MYLSQKVSHLLLAMTRRSQPSSCHSPVYIAKNVTVHSNCHVGATNRLVVEGEVIPDNTVVFGEGLRRTQQDMARVCRQTFLVIHINVASSGDVWRPADAAERVAA